MAINRREALESNYRTALATLHRMYGILSAQANMSGPSGTYGFDSALQSEYDTLSTALGTCKTALDAIKTAAVSGQIG